MRTAARWTIILATLVATPVVLDLPGPHTWLEFAAPLGLFAVSWIASWNHGLTRRHLTGGLSGHRAASAILQASVIGLAVLIGIGLTVWQRFGLPGSVLNPLVAVGAVLLITGWMIPYFYRRATPRAPVRALRDDQPFLHSAPSAPRTRAEFDNSIGQKTGVKEE
jgi:hypothetical protein